MSWRLRVRHTTGYRYDAPVMSSYNEARLTPVTDVDQLTLEARVETTPDAVQQRYWDYWGTQVTAFDLHAPHDALQVTASCTVDTADARSPADVPSWDRVRSAAVRDRYVELLTPTPRTRPSEEMTALAREHVAALDPGRRRPRHHRAGARSRGLPPGSTGVATSAGEAWDLGTGVCQDIAHVTVGLLRSVGLPAAYVSGYLHPKASAGIGETITGESHAWVEVWLGSWWGYDPTNRIPPGSGTSWWAAAATTAT
jgi:transglutaminase-like putative cysteine protease